MSTDLGACVCVFDIGCYAVIVVVLCPNCASWWSSIVLFWIFVAMYMFLIYVIV